jgi:hypothetical protein
VGETSEIRAFLERAKTNGISDDAIVGILTARGWSEKDVYQSLAAHYEELTGIKIPVRRSAGTAAKDAFFYLLTFSALATWTIALGSLAFTLINRWFTDNLFSPGYAAEYEIYGATWNLAAIIVSFPIYLLLSRALVRDIRNHPEKLASAVRKWLTYLALVIAASIFIGDLITALTYLLRGEITSRFILKALVVLILSGGVLFYYFGGLREPGDGAPKRGFSRDALMAALSAILVLAGLALGFGFTGPPKTQRTQRADSKRTQDLFMLSQQINVHWNTTKQKLPEHLDELQGVVFADPVTRSAYGYRPKENNKYQLCATFSGVSPQDGQSSVWAHPSGYYCFSFDASQPTPGPPYVFDP